MIEAIQVAALDAAKTGAGGMSPAQTTQAQATPYDVRDFAATMERTGGPPGTAAAPATTPTIASEPSQGTRAVLGALDGLNGGADKIESMSQLLTANGADLTPSEMVQLTMRSHQFLFTAQLTSNVANRSSDGIQQLFRQQS
jgi:hypothetical protein